MLLLEAPPFRGLALACSYLSAKRKLARRFVLLLLLVLAVPRLSNNVAPRAEAPL